MNTVASPRPCWKISLAYIPPVGPCLLETLGADDRVELSQRSLPPGEYVLAVDRLFHGDGGGRRHGAMLHLAWRLRSLQQLT
ncbi:MAG: hypothetical protein WBP81_08035 [Solirubrobacteraceae bacterium]